MRQKILLTVVLAAFTAIAQDDTASKSRGVRLRRQPGNVTYDVVLVRNTERSIVSTNYRFQTGDRFTLRIKLAADSYVYLLSRTFVGAADELSANRQFRLVPNARRAADPAPGSSGAEEASAQAPPYTLIYPPSGHRRVKAGQVSLVPGPSLALEMDENPGLEQLLLVVSPARLDLSAAAGADRRDIPSLSAAPHGDTPSDVNAQFTDRLNRMAENADVEEPPARARKIVIEEPAPGKQSLFPPEDKAPTDSDGKSTASAVHPKPSAGGAQPGQVTAPKRVHQPYLVNIILSHYPAPRL